MNLSEIQKNVHQVRADRGFTMEPLRIFTLLTEEIGEIAHLLKRTWSPNYEAFNKEEMQDELADVLVMVIALANHYEIDLETAIQEKFIERDGKRAWKSAQKG